MRIRDWDYEGIAFRARRRGEIVTLYFSSNPMIKLTNLEAKSELFEYMDMVAGHKEIRAVIFHSNPEKSGRKEYLAFYNDLLSSRINRDALIRMYNAVNQFILRIIDMAPVTIHLNSGQIIMMFLNVSLACDHRIIADDTVFQNPCRELGMIPKGGGAYFLSIHLGRAKAFEVMASCRDIHAGEALALGLVNEVTTLDILEERGLEVAEEYIRTPGPSLYGIKRLLNHQTRDLAEFLAYENEEILRIVDARITGRC